MPQHCRVRPQQEDTKGNMETHPSKTSNHCCLLMQATTEDTSMAEHPR